MVTAPLLTAMLPLLILFNYFARGFSPFTVIPMLRAVPATMLIADSIVKQLRSGILASAICRTYSQVTEATLTRLGSAEPFAALDISFS